MKDQSLKLYTCDGCRNRSICKYYDQMMQLTGFIKEHFGKFPESLDVILSLKCDAYVFRAATCSMLEREAPENA